jgi:hypothetical protein
MNQEFGLQASEMIRAIPVTPMLNWKGSCYNEVGGSFKGCL